MAQYVENVRTVKKVIDLADADSHKWLQYAKHTMSPMAIVYYREYLTLKRYERRLADSFDHTIAISEDEKTLFESYMPGVAISVVPNGVDLEYFKGAPRNDQLSSLRAADNVPSAAKQSISKHDLRLLRDAHSNKVPRNDGKSESYPSGRLRSAAHSNVPRLPSEALAKEEPALRSQTTLSFSAGAKEGPTPALRSFSEGGSHMGSNLVFIGAMDYFANVDAVLYFYRAIFPIIREKIPDVKFYIVGSRPVKSIQKLKRDKNIIVTGFVEDTRPYLESSKVCVAPLRIARGMQNKILEAMASGVPVVTTTRGNEGINARDGENIYVKDEPREFAWSVIDLLKNVELRNAMSQSAQKFVEEKYSWETNMAKLDRILLEAREIGGHNTYFH